MTARPALYLLLAVVATAAAVLSFAALRDLALLCGFSARLAWLLPVVVDAGAAAGSLVWLGGHGDLRAQRFACRLALVLLASSVAANAVSHGLEAYRLRPAWWVVVVVSAISPAVLGAVVHLAVLVGRATVGVSATPNLQPGVTGAATVGVSPSAASDREILSEPAPDVTSHPEISSPPLDVEPPTVALHLAPAPTHPGEAGDRATELIAAGAGRRRLSRELGISEHEARRKLTARRNGASP